MVACMGPKNPMRYQDSVSFEQLQKYAFILLKEGYVTTRYAIEELQKYGSPNIVYNISNPEQTPQLIRNTDLVYLGIDPFDREEITPGEYKSIRIENTKPFSICAVFSKRNHNNKRNDLAGVLDDIQNKLETMRQKES